MEAWLNTLLGLSAETICFALFFFCFLENVVPPIPGDAVIVFGGYLAGQGNAGVPAALASATLGSFVGFMAVYYLSLTKGRSFVISRTRSQAARRRIEMGERWLGRYGDKVILVNRFLPGVRSVISLVAGVGGMPARRIAPYALISAAVWDGLLISSGVLAGAHWEAAVALLKTYNRIVGAVLVIVAGVALAVVYRRRRQSRRKASTINCQPSKGKSVNRQSSIVDRTNDE